MLLLVLLFLFASNPMFQSQFMTHLCQEWSSDAPLKPTRSAWHGSSLDCQSGTRTRCERDTPALRTCVLFSVLFCGSSSMRTTRTLEVVLRKTLLWTVHSGCCCDGFVSRCCGLSRAQSSSSSTTEWRKCQGSLRQLVMEAWTLCGMLSMAGSQPRSHYLLSAIIHPSTEALVFVHVDFTTAPPWVCPFSSYKSIIALYCSIRTAHIFQNWCLWVIESFASIVGRLNCLLPKAYISPPKKTQPHWIN
jgi:hypothetical protein